MAEENVASRVSVMPKRVDLGRHAQVTIGHAIMNREKSEYDTAGRRSVMGFPLPEWQRPFVWSREQCIRFIESAWLGLNLGTYSYNQLDEPGARLDGLLIDGQQRMRALERYLDDEFPVFGHRWSEVTKRDRNSFNMTTVFACYITRSEDENWLRGYYDLMNFSGTAHTEDQRALPYQEGSNA